MGIGDGIISLLDPEKIDGVVWPWVLKPPPLAAESQSLWTKESLLISRCFSSNRTYHAARGEVKLKKLALCFVQKNSMHQKLASNSSLHLVQD